VAATSEHQSFDYVIVGAGSAGCVLANRLSEDPNVTVAILEAGGANKSLLVKMPAGASKLFNSKNASNWAFETAPQKELGGRSLFQPRGRGLGGSSAINAMLYVRGHARDYDQWRQTGLGGWGYGDVLPYFKRAQHHQSGADAWNAEGGPLWVSPSPPGYPLHRVFIEAAAQAGYPTTRDFNGRQQEGAGPYHLTIKDGRRWSASVAYLDPIVRARKNLSVITGAHAHKVLIENRAAKGVVYSVGSGKPARTILAKREVLVCAGAFQSPQLLMMSGVGPAEHLRAFDVPVVVDAPQVGRNLQDHLDVGVIYECTQPITLYSLRKGWREPMIGIDYIFRNAGHGRTIHLHSGAFLKTRGELDRPDIQIHFVNAIMMDHGRAQVNQDGFTIHAYPVRPESRGEVRLTSSDPLAPPLIDPHYLESPNDLRTVRDSVRIVRDIVNQEAFAPFRGGEFQPGASVRTDSEIDAWIRRTAETLYHPVGTCRMGADEASVVDGDLRVRGVSGLRVIDASVMPTLIGGNTNAPTIMIAEKASDMIRGWAPLPREDAPIAEDALAGAA